MNLKALHGLLAAVILFLCLSGPATGGPILKPRKYHGPIPPGSFSLRVGFLGNATNAEMLEFLDSRRTSAEQAISDDFSNGLTFDITYMYKPHPQFGVRVNTSIMQLESTGSGFFVSRPAGLPDSIPSPVLDYDRTFTVDLITLELSGVYYFADAAVSDFQPYAGGGFTVGFPHESFEEIRINRDTGERTSIASSEWSTEAGVHGVLGAFYYITNRTAISIEARTQILQSTFPLKTPNELGQPENVRFVVDYTGFSLGIGITRAF